MEEVALVGIFPTEIIVNIGWSNSSFSHQRRKKAFRQIYRIGENMPPEYKDHEEADHPCVTDR
jgi:hypothetical protein